jgi:hypothetical protein
MMRNELQKLNGQRMRFRGTVERYGSRSNWHGYPETTILLKDVCFASNGELACDHIWFKEGTWAWELEVGTTFEFDARVDSYMKGYQGRRAEELELACLMRDYLLERPSKVIVTTESAGVKV